MNRTDELRLRLLGPRPVSLMTDKLWGWLGPGLIALVGGFLRFWNLDHPRALVFDETYYVKQAASMLRFKSIFLGGLLRVAFLRPDLQCCNEEKQRSLSSNSRAMMHQTKIFK